MPALRRAAAPVECYYLRGKLYTRDGVGDEWRLDERKRDAQAARDERHPAQVLDVSASVRSSLRLAIERS